MSLDTQYMDQLEMYYIDVDVFVVRRRQTCAALVGRHNSSMEFVNCIHECKDKIEDTKWGNQKS